MSFSSEYNKLRKKKREEEAAAQNQSSGSFSDQYNALRTAQPEDDGIDYSGFAPISKYLQTRAQENTLSKLNTFQNAFSAIAQKQKEEDKDRTWFKAGEFDDGYQFGDVTKTILGTAADTVANVGGGLLEMGENVVDAGAYLVGGVGELFGAKDFAEGTKNFIANDLYSGEEIASRIISLGIKGEGGFDSASVFGEKIDSVAQSGGQLAGQIAGQFVGIPWWVTSGVTTFGKEVETAFNEGATYEEAGLSGLVSAGAEILTEKLFGGSGLGEKGLIKLDGLTKALSGKTVKAFADLGIDMAAEGVEEVVSSVINRMGSALYKEENLAELLTSEEAVDEYIESFIGGAALGGIMNAAKVDQARAKKGGRDYRTGLTANEQKVFDEVYKEAIAEEKKKTGKELSKKEEAKIYDEVMESLQKGQVSTDTIERLLGGESYTAYQDAIKNDNAAIEEMKKLYEGEELEQRIKDILDNSKRGELKEQLSKEVFDIAESEGALMNKSLTGKRGSFLSESYHELAKRGQAFEADLSQYDEKYHSTIQKAIDSGILNNTRRTHEMVELFAKLSSDKGVEIDFTNNEKIKEASFAVEGKTVNGYVTENGDIAINIDSPRYLNSIVGHEITHILEGAKSYGELQKIVEEYAESKGEYKDRLRTALALYKDVEGYKGADGFKKIKREVVADLVGDYIFTDAEFVRNLHNNNRNVFQKIWDEIKYLYKVATAGSKEAKQLEQVKHLFEKVYQEGGKATGEVKHSLGYHAGDLGKARYSLGEKTLDKYTEKQYNAFGWARDTEAISKNELDDMYSKIQEKGSLKKFAQSSHGEAIIEVNDKPHTTLGTNNVFAFVTGTKNNPQITRVVRFQAETETEMEIIKERLYERGSFSNTYYSFLREYGTAREYSKKSALDYIGYKEKARRRSIGAESNGAEENGGLLQNGSRTSSETQSNEIAPYQEASSTDGVFFDGQKRKYSLSAEQEAYFKDSVVRDEDGNLKVMYHGTSSGGHTVFDTYGSNYGLFGKGSYFTDNKEIAESYTKKGKGKNPQVYESYLNITNPMDMDAEANPFEWQKAFPDADFPTNGTNEDFYRAMEEYFMDEQYPKWEAAEAAIDSLIGMGYDGITHIGGGRVNPDGVKHRVYIAFEPEQIKNTDNLKPTSDPDIRFSLSEPVEETPDLIAIHNMQSSELSKALALGGMPMPSIAIIKAQQSHESYGDVSIVFPKDAIDPSKSRENKVYGGDAWTPTYPSIEYKASAKAQKAIEDKINSLVPRDVQRALGNISLDYDNLSSDLNRYNGDMYKAYGYNRAMQYAFLVDNGLSEKLPTTEKQLDGSGRFDNSVIIDVVEKLGASEIEKFANEDIWGNEALIAELRDIANENAKSKYNGDSKLLEILRNRPLYTEKNFGFAQADGIIRAAFNYVKNGVEQTVDHKAAGDVIENAIDKDAYKKWLDDLFADIVEKEGIRNNADYYTPSGNRRSWEALHWENTLENVLKVMKAQNQTGEGFFGGASIFGVANKNYGSIEEIKADSDRLRTIPEEEYDALKETFSNRLVEIADSIKDPNERNGFIAIDNAVEEIVDAVRANKTKSGILRYMSKWNKRVTAETVDEIISLVTDISNMPTGYFEAKPQRAVGFDEVGVFVIPNNADIKLKQELLNRGYSIAEYNPNVEGDRQRVVNQFEEYKFSLSDVGETPIKRGNLNIKGEDVRFEAPIREDIGKTETASDVAPLPQYNVPPSEPNIAELQEQMGGLEKRLLETAQTGKETGDYSSYIQLLGEYEELQNKIEQAEAQEKAYQSERLASLDESQMPPEVEAPYVEESNIEDEDVDSLDPMAERDYKNVGKRSVKAYMYENPEVKPFFQDAAGVMLWDLGESTKGERWYNDQLYYDTNGEKGWMGTKRMTTADIAALLDSGYTYDEIRKGLEAIIEDNGAENNACSKRIEFMLNERLLYGYKDVDGRPIPPDQEYINLLKEKQITEYNEESFKSYLDSVGDNSVPPMVTDGFAPIRDDIAPKVQTPKQQTIDPALAEEATAKILTEEPQAEKKKSRGWSKIVSNIFDKGSVFETLSLKKGNRELQAKYNNLHYSEGRAQRLIGKGSKTNGVTALNDIQKDVEKAGLTKQLYEYMYHQHNIDRMTLDQRFGIPNKTVFGDAVTADVSREAVANLERQHPNLKWYAEELYAFNKHLRKMLVDGGVISQETADLWEKMYPHYVPIRRLGDAGLNVNVPLDTARTGVNAPIKRATGGSRDILPLFDTMAQRAIQTYKAVAKNSFGVELKNTLGVSAVSNVENVANTIDEMMENVDKHEDLLQKGENGRSPTFTVFENGQRVTFDITEDMYDALKPTSEGLAHTYAIPNKLSQMHKNLLTEYNPVFMFTNAIKDAQDVLMNSQHAAKTYASFPKAVKELVNSARGKEGKWLAEYMENGGEQNTYFDNQEGNFVKEKSGFSKLIGMPLEAISAANNFIERIPRLAEYIASRESGRSIEVSMLDAARVTTNFAAGGDVTKFANRNGATFLNASVQGFMQQVRNVREAKHNGMKGWALLATKAAGVGLAVEALNRMLWDDDEEYEELSDYVKQNYYVVAKTADGQFVRIPKGRTLAVIQNAFEQVSNALTGDDEVDLGTFLELAVSNLAPNNPIDNNIIAPIMQVASNKTWYGEDLVPTRLQDLPAAEQYDESTDSISKWLGENLNVSPYKINYLLNQYSGGLGDVFLPMLTPEAERGEGNPLIAPFTDKFSTDSVMNNQNVSDFYDKMDELTTNAKSSKATDEDVLKYKFFNAVNSELGELYQQKREIQNSSLSDGVKFAKIRELQEQINSIARDSLREYENANIDGVYATVGNIGYRLHTSETGEQEWQKITDKQLEKQEKVTSGLGISASEYWSNKGEYDFAYEHPEKYSFLNENGYSYSDYDNADEDGKRALTWASENPTKYEVSKVVVDDIFEYRRITGELYDIKADKDANGKTISGSRKEKVVEHINNLDLDYGAKIILFKSEYNADDTYNQDIVDYLNSRNDLSYSQMETILKELGFTVDAQGNIYW